MEGAIDYSGMNVTVAPDTSRFDRRLRVREAVRSSTAHEGRRRAVVRKRRTLSMAEARYIGVPLRTAVCFIVCAAMLTMVLSAYATLSEENVRMTKAQTMLAGLKEMENRLVLQRECTMNMDDIKNRAMDLGMVTPEREQYVYIDLSGEECGRILKKESFFSKLGIYLGELADPLLEYFR